MTRYDIINKRIRIYPPTYEQYSCKFVAFPEYSKGDRIGFILESIGQFDNLINNALKVHRNPIRGGYFNCEDSWCCDYFGIPNRGKMGLPIIKYDSTDSGDIKIPISYKIMPFIFDVIDIDRLKLGEYVKKDKLLSVINNDVRVTCDEKHCGEPEHRMHFCAESLWRLQGEEFLSKVFEEAKPMWGWLKNNIPKPLNSYERDQIKIYIERKTVEESELTIQSLSNNSGIENRSVNWGAVFSSM
jgi:hypothetical protein